MWERSHESDRCSRWLLAVAAVLLGAAGGCGGTEDANTVTVERTTTATETPPPTAATPPAPSGYVKCDANIRAKLPNTTCPFAQNTFWGYWTLDRKRSISVWSPAAKASFTTTCEEGADEVVCTTPKNAEVRLSLAALNSYSQEQRIGTQRATTSDLTHTSLHQTAQIQRHRHQTAETTTASRVTRPAWRPEPGTTTATAVRGTARTTPER